jgi:hypothetical protein
VSKLLGICRRFDEYFCRVYNALRLLVTLTLSYPVFDGVRQLWHCKCSSNIEEARWERRSSSNHAEILDDS